MNSPNTTPASESPLEGVESQTLDELNRAVTIEREFHPDPDGRAAYAPLYKEFPKLYKAHKGIHARLNG